MSAAIQMAEKVLVAGRSFNSDVLTSKGYSVHTHWNRIPATRSDIPMEVDLVVLVSDDVDMLLTQYVRDLCEKNLIPLVFTKKNMENLEACVKKAHDVVEVQQTLESMEEAKNTNLEEVMEDKTDARSTGVNVQRKNQKMDLVRELLKSNPTTPTETLQEEVVKKFGKGLTPSTITELRTKEFNVKIGPRGTVNGSVVSHPTAKRAARASVNTKDSLESILNQLRKVMAATGTQKVEIDANGHARIQGGTRELDLRA